MINWEASFITPYSQTLANGTIGNAREHARAITNSYINSIRLGIPVGIPPTLPSTIFPFPPVPVGPGVFFNLYETRRQLFENTIYIYYQGKNLLHSRSNIQDLIVSVKRLQTKAKQTRDRIKTLQTELKLVEDNIKQLPDQFREFFEDLKQIIQDQINDLKNLNLDGRAISDKAFATAFAEEIDLYTKIINFKPSLNPANYAVFLDLYTTITNQYKRLTTGDGFRAYLLNKLEAVVQYVLVIVQGFVDPTEILLFIQNIAAANDRYKPTYQKIIKLLRLQSTLNKVQLRVKKEIEEEKKRLSGIIKPKLEKLKAVVNGRLNSYKSALVEYNQSLSKVKFIKQIQDFTKRQKKKIKRKKQQIKQIKIIAQQVRDIESNLTSILSGIKSDYRQILLEIKQLESLNVVAKQSYGELVNVPEKQLQELKSIDKSNLQELSNLSSDLLGKNSALFVTLLGLTDLPANAKSYVKVKLNTIDSRYESYLDNLTTLIIKTKTVDKLLNLVTNTTEDVSVVDKQITNIQTDADLEINNAIEKRRLRGKPTLRDVFFLFDDLSDLLALFAPKTSKLVKQLETDLKNDLKAFEENSKFVKEIKVINAKIKQRFNQKEKTEQEAVEKAEQAKRNKKRIEKTQQFAVMVTSASQIGSNVLQKRYMLSESEQPIKRFINSYYKYLEIDREGSVQQLRDQQKKTLGDLTKIIQYESFIILLLDLYRSFDIKAFVEELKAAIAVDTENYKQLPQTTKNSVDRIIQVFNSPSFNSAKDIVAVLNELSYEAIDTLTNFTALQQAESKYTKRFLQLISQFEALKNNPSELDSNNSVFKQFFEDVKKNGSIVLTLIKYVKKYVIEPSRRYIKEHVQKVVEKIKKKVKQETNKFKERTKVQRQKLKDKLVNVDAIAMSVMFNVATRLFWTGATWTNPAGTTFIVLNIGTFRKIKALPKDGAAGIAREMGLNFKTQLSVATGQVIPNPATGIPPFPFVGYI